MQVTRQISLWADGSCYPNPGPGGWAWHDGNGREEWGSEHDTTNNRMELTAILRAMRALPDGAAATIYSDSKYCVNGLTVWRDKWKRRNWMKAGEAMLNRDLWLALDAQQCRVQARLAWVRGHAGNAGNEHADRLAEAARKALLRAT